MVDIWSIISQYQEQYAELKDDARLFVENNPQLDAPLYDEIFQQMLFMKFAIYVLRGHAGDVSIDEGENVSPVQLAHALFRLEKKVSVYSLTLEENQQNFHCLFSESYTKVLNMISV